jgi:hypothetical protein
MSKDNTLILKNACICCGNDIKVSYTGEESKYFAEATDICAKCWEAGCTGLSHTLPNEERYCKVYNKPSKPL